MSPLAGSRVLVTLVVAVLVGVASPVDSSPAGRVVQADPVSQLAQTGAGPDGNVISNVDGRLEVFRVDWTTGQIVHVWQHSPGGPWSSWAPISPASGGSFIWFEVARNADGRLEVFATATAGLVDYDLWHAWQVVAGGAWVPWQQLGTDLFRFDVAANADGRLEVVGAGYGAEFGTGVAHAYQLVPNGTWSAWSNLTASIPDEFGTWGEGGQLIGNADGRLEFFLGTDRGIVHAYQVAPNSSWSGWAFLVHDGHLSDFTVGANADGRLEVFAAMWSEGRIVHAWQVVPNGPWSGWLDLATFPDRAEGDPSVRPAVGIDADGRLEVFFTLASGMHHVWQVAPNGSWSGRHRLDPQLASTIWGVGRNADGRLEVVYDSAFGQMGHAWQWWPNGDWSGYEPFVG